MGEIFFSLNCCWKLLGTPEEIAGAGAFLSSRDAAYVTGETLVVSGGMQSKL